MLQAEDVCREKKEHENRHDTQISGKGKWPEENYTYEEDLA